jgi:hypothetical protein
VATEEEEKMMNEEERFLLLLHDLLQDILAGEKTKEVVLKEIHGVIVVISRRLRPPIEPSA